MVDLCLLGKNIALERRIGAHFSAVQPKRVAGATGEAQGRARHALIDCADIERHSKMAFAAACDVSPAEQEHRSSLAEGHLPVSGKRVRRIADVVGAAERERLSAGNRRLTAELVAVVEQRPGTQVESAAEREDVIQRLQGTKSELA